MKMGIKEFRERLSEVARGGQPIELTHHGKVVGTYVPKTTKDIARARKAAGAVARWQEEMRARGVDLEGELAAMGLTPWGEPVDADDRR